MNDIQTIILLLILAANLGSMLLYFKLMRLVNDGQSDAYDYYEVLSEDHDYLSKDLRDEALVTRQRIAQVKNRLADEERDDQRAKRMERAKG